MEIIEKLVPKLYLRVEDGVEVPTDEIFKFFENDAYDLECTIDCSDNYTDVYIYFDDTPSDRLLEKVLLNLGVIRFSPYYSIHNTHVANKKPYYKGYRYWLGSGYRKFKEEFHNLYRLS